MTKPWNTTTTLGSVSRPLGEANNRTICWCEDNNVYATIYLRELAGNIYFCYAYGDDNSWTEEVLVKSNLVTGRLGIQGTVEDFSLDVDQTGGANDHVHIAFTINDILYHSELKAPTVPADDNNWTTWTNRYQRVDNNQGGFGYTSPSISIDGNGDPHIVYQHEDNGGNSVVKFNYGNGANHAFTPGSELQLAGPYGHGISTTIMAVVGATRDLYVFWDTGTTISYRYCANAGAPLVIGSWTAAAVVLTFVSSTNVYGVSYWYDGGAPKAQIYIAGNDISGATKSNWYDEGNVNGWGGGWRGQVNEIPNTSSLQVTQVDANDFALVYWSATSQGQFAFTDYASSDYDCVTSTFYYFTNATVGTCSTEFRGREHDNFSFGVLHVQTSIALFFDLVRINFAPTATNLDPDNGDRENEEAAITLSWSFSDAGQVQTQWRIEVDEYDTGWASPIWASGVQSGSDASDDIPASTLAFNTHYEWRIKVWDDEKGTEYDPYSESDWVS